MVLAQAAVWGSYGMLCRASITAPDLGTALKRWCRHHGLLTRDIVLSLAEADGWPASTSPSTGRSANCTNSAWCRSCAHEPGPPAGRWIRASARLRRLSPSRAAHADVYPLMFARPIASMRPAQGGELMRAISPCRCAATRTRWTACCSGRSPLTVLQYRRDRLLVEPGCGNCCAPRPGGQYRGRQPAAQLHVGAHLHRQLRKKALAAKPQDEARRDRALHLLQRSARPLKQIAAEVGFRNEKSFARAFQRPGRALRRAASAAVEPRQMRKAENEMLPEKEKAVSL